MVETTPPPSPVSRINNSTLSSKFGNRDRGIKQFVQRPLQYLRQIPIRPIPIKFTSMLEQNLMKKNGCAKGFPFGVGFHSPSFHTPTNKRSPSPNQLAHSTHSSESTIYLSDDEFDFDINAERIVEDLVNNDSSHPSNHTPNTIPIPPTSNKKSKIQKVKRIDDLKINQHGFGMCCNVDYVRNLKLDKMKQIRAGIIPYFVKDNKKYFGLGVDNKYGSLTDFGGGVKITFENVIEGAIREFKEETLNVFPNISSSMIKNGIAVYNDHVVIIFVKFSLNYFHIDAIKRNFLEKAEKRQHLEICTICWYQQTKLLEIVNKFHQFGIDTSFKKPHDYMKDPYIYSKIQPLLWSSFTNGNLSLYLR